MIPDVSPETGRKLDRAADVVSNLTLIVLVSLNTITLFALVSIVSVPETFRSTLIDVYTYALAFLLIGLFTASLAATLSSCAKPVVGGDDA